MNLPSRNLLSFGLGVGLALGLAWGCRPLLAQTFKCDCTVFTSVRTGDGSAGSPSLTFDSAPTKGFYELSATVIGVSGMLAPGVDATYNLGITGTNRFLNGYFSGTVVDNVTSLGNGSSGSPSLTFTSDLTTGLYRFAASVIGISGGLKFGTDNTVDIGATAANRPKNIFASGLVTGLAFQVGAGTATTSNVVVRSSDVNGQLSVMLGDGSDTAQIYGRSLRLVPGATGQPTCDTTTRGLVWFTQAGAGSFDGFQICRKDETENYAWANIFYN